MVNCVSDGLTVFVCLFFLVRTLSLDGAALPQAAWSRSRSVACCNTDEKATGLLAL